MFDVAVTVTAMVSLKLLASDAGGASIVNTYELVRSTQFITNVGTLLELLTACDV